MVSTSLQQLLCLLCPQPAGPLQKGNKALRAPEPTRSRQRRWHQQHPLPTAQPLTSTLHEGSEQPCSSEGDILAVAGAAPTCCTRWSETQHVLGRGDQLTPLLQGSQHPPEQARAMQAPGWGTRWLQALRSAFRSASPWNGPCTTSIRAGLIPRAGEGTEGRSRRSSRIPLSRAAGLLEVLYLHRCSQNKKGEKRTTSRAGRSFQRGSTHGPTAAHTQPPASVKHEHRTNRPHPAVSPALPGHDGARPQSSSHG